jgi:putative DNA primase/helicase
MHGSDKMSNSTPLFFDATTVTPTGHPTYYDDRRETPLIEILDHDGEYDSERAPRLNGSSHASLVVRDPPSTANEAIARFLDFATSEISYGVVQEAYSYLAQFEISTAQAEDCHAALIRKAPKTLKVQQLRRIFKECITARSAKLDALPSEAEAAVAAKPTQGKYILASKSDHTAAARAFNDSRVGRGFPAYFWRGYFYEWTGAYYRKLEPRRMTDMLRRFLDNAQVKVLNRDGDCIGYADYQPNLALLANVEDAMRTLVNIESSLDAPFWIECEDDATPAKEFIGLLNGLYHVPSRKKYDHTKNMFNLGVANVVFDANAPQPTNFKRFLAQTFAGCEDSPLTLQELFGYYLAGATHLQKIGMFLGAGRGGKGTTVKILERAIGADNIAASGLSEITETFGLQPFMDKSLAIMNEASDVARSAASPAPRMKAISGNDLVSVNHKNGFILSVRLPTRILVVCNSQLTFKDASGVLATRLVVIEFNHSQLGKEDPHLLERDLFPEMPGIFNWAMDGYARLLQQGAFTVTSGGMHSAEEMAQAGSPLMAFLSDRCVVDDTTSGNCETTTDLYVA